MTYMTNIMLKKCLYAVQNVKAPLKNVPFKYYFKKLFNRFHCARTAYDDVFTTPFIQIFLTIKLFTKFSEYHTLLLIQLKEAHHYDQYTLYVRSNRG